MLLDYMCFYEKRWDRRIIIFASNNLINQGHETGYSSLGERVSSMEQHLPKAWYPLVEIAIHVGHVACLKERRLNTSRINKRSTFVSEVPNAICCYTLCTQELSYWQAKGPLNHEQLLW